MTNDIKKKRSAPLFPKNKKILSEFGENIKLACKRRKYTQSLIADRTGLSRATVRKIEQGDPTVSIGHYVAVLGVLGLVEDFAKVASDDELGRKLQDIKLKGGDAQSRAK
ncbi:HipB protein @ Antitoxin HigA [hydrothermal vent metagenome]|uniref:HipB protein @ Antitoxin HigA n=1 Tax=hydrothermal vent metagenome TaxID=652676 RepID=A0A3B0WE24_9ZZZZ